MWLRRIGFLLFAFMLTGCATPPAKIITQRAAEPDGPYAFNGRVAIKHQNERESAGLRWVSVLGEDDILLLAPLGQTIARIHRSEQGVGLEASGKQYFARDANELTHRVLGWELPLAGLRYWVRGIPAEGGVADIQRDANGQITQLRQDGWEINYSRYASTAEDSLPLRFVLQREHLEIKVIIDEWEKQ